MMYYVSKPDEYLVVMGLGIDSMKIIKHGFCWPFQTVKRFSISPLNYSFSLQAMSIEKLEFILPAVFTIGPKNDPASLQKYARLLSSAAGAPSSSADTGTKKHLQDIVKGVIEGETRVIAAGMSIEEIFKERKHFKEEVIKNVQAELDQFGLLIYNANVKQLEDSPGSEYFIYLRKKSQEGAVNQAKVDVAEAKMKGDIGEKQRQGLTRQELSQLEADTIVFENQRQKEIASAQADLKAKQADYSKKVEIAQIEGVKAAAIVDAELQKNVEAQNALVQQEKLRAEQLAKAKVDAEATKTLADAALYEAQKKADAKLYKEIKKSEGIQQIYEAQSEGISELVKSFNGNSSAAIRYLMLESNLYTDIAKNNGAAMKGLKPNVTVWNSSEKEGSLTDLMQQLPPIFSTIAQQTGINPPNWLAKMPAGQAPEVAVSND